MRPLRDETIQPAGTPRDDPQLPGRGRERRPVTAHREYGKSPMMRDKPLVLAVDDRAENLNIVRMRLEAQGYDVVTATSGEAALAIVAQDRPDLILLDVMMPGMDG